MKRSVGTGPVSSRYIDSADKQAASARDPESIAKLFNPGGKLSGCPSMTHGDPARHYRTTSSELPADTYITLNPNRSSLRQFIYSVPDLSWKGAVSETPDMAHMAGDEQDSDPETSNACGHLGCTGSQHGDG